MFATRIENVCLRSYSGSLVPKNLKLESPSRPGKNRAANPFKTLTHVAGENFKLKRICGDSLLCLHHDATVPSGKVGSHSASEHRASTSSIDLAVQRRRGRAPQVYTRRRRAKRETLNFTQNGHRSSRPSRHRIYHCELLLVLVLGLRRRQYWRLLRRGTIVATARSHLLLGAVFRRGWHC